MKQDEYRAVAAIIREHDNAAMHMWLAKQRVFSRGYIGYVQPKERPRHSKNGHTYTPPKTVAFEASVRKWFDKDDIPVIYFPVCLSLTIGDKNPPKIGDKADMFLRNCGFVTSQKGDLDNKVKAVSDALNGHLYADDKQITALMVYRKYMPADGFYLDVYRSGFSAFEVAQIKKFI